jgi:hypothetical protein
LGGFPPKEIDANPEDTIQKIGIVNSDTLTIEQNLNAVEPIPEPTQREEKLSQVIPELVDLTVDDEPELGLIPEDGSMVRRVIDSDNSCLFNSLG